VAKAKLRDALDDLRACKTLEELALMKRANDVSGSAHRAVMAAARPEMKEYHLQSVFEAECLRASLKHLAYPSIVATGANAAVLHYRHNDAVLKDGDLLLIDAGAEDKGYAADITRTFPVNGRFTSRQRDVYEIVLAAQKSCIERARAGVVSADLHVHSMRVIADGLKSLGLLKGDTDGLVEGGAVRLFYPHGLTHMLGLDVHDVTGGKRRILPNPTKVPVRFVARLEPGFVITMEPGIYFIAALLEDRDLRRKHKASVDFAKAETFLDFGGIRIEDDIVITDDAPLNLTTVPKEIADVEAACER
jgi:Xaa-Pro dipeptidase